jgi:hypothetical protein
MAGKGLTKVISMIQVSYLIFFYNPIEHKNSFTVLFPDHEPEVACGMR